MHVPPFKQGEESQMEAVLEPAVVVTVEVDTVVRVNVESVDETAMVPVIAG